MIGLWSNSLKRVSILLIVGGAVLLSIWSVRPDVAALTPGNYYQIHCQTGAAAPSPSGSVPSEGQQLRLLLVTPYHADELAQRLCQSETVQQQFSQVEVSWKPRTELTTADLLNERYDVIWNREHFLTGLSPDFNSYYDTLLQFDHYAVYWLSMTSEPVLTAEYFNGKRIGLLDDPSSHTHHLLPLRSLRQAQVNNETASLVYFRDAASLYEAFYKGQIDVISAGQSLPAPAPVFKTLLDANATAATFFVRQQLADTRLRCELSAALMTLAPLWEDIESHRSDSSESC
ncbi:MAG: hypothetical protein VYE29_11345 [Pseudomonadota bacterium]|nr:hypothetical protein [Pseudomonadota bacterium]